jgi:hypothetical protein
VFVQGYVYKLEPGVGLGYHPDGVKNATLFLNFPYACPEPVLAK